jgi:hypothetical protein
MHLLSGRAARTLLTAVILGGLLALWILRRRVFPGYLEVWSVWSAGGSTTSMSLWGLSLLWWGRIGKLMEFAAGLAVVLDLIKPESLRVFGDRTGALWRRYRDYFRLIQMVRIWRFGRAIFWSLHHSYQESDGRGNVRTVSFLWPGEPTPLAQPSFDIAPDTLAAFQRELLAFLLARRHDTPRDSWTVGHSMIFQFISDQLPAERRVRVEVLSRWVRLDNLIGVTLFMILLIVPVVLLFTGGRPFFGDAWPWWGNVLLIFGCVALLITIDYLPFVLLGIALAPVAGAARLGAWLLDRPRPAHMLKVLAFAVFIVGFHFDLLAS